MSMLSAYFKKYVMFKKLWPNFRTIIKKSRFSPTAQFSPKNTIGFRAQSTLILSNFNPPKSAVSFVHTSCSPRKELGDIKIPLEEAFSGVSYIWWSKAVGDQVKEDEVLCQIESFFKTSVPVMAPAAGVIEEIFVKDGAIVQPGMSICKIRVGATSSDLPKKEASAPAAASAPPPVVPPPVPSKPSAPQGVTKPLDFIKIPVTPTPLPPGQAESTITGSRTELRVQINRMRLRIAQRLKEAQNTYAMLTTFDEIDMSNVIEMRNKYKDAFLKKHNIKLGFLSTFLKASTYALQDQPVLNAYIDKEEIVYRDYIDISVAVATPKGLVTPVIRSLEKMNYAEIEREICALGKKARAGSLAIEDLDGGTFAVGNIEILGALNGTTVINPPQSATLGLHSIVDRPVAVKGKVEIRPMMYVALTYDHRLIDGREAVLFLRKIKAAVEDPRIMFMDI